MKKLPLLLSLLLATNAWSIEEEGLSKQDIRFLKTIDRSDKKNEALGNSIPYETKVKLIKLCLSDPPLSSEHPALATHPITGRTSLCYPGRDGGGALACVPTDGSIEQWQEYEDWIWEYMNAPENQFRMNWEEGDFLIWDNMSCIHNYFGGWRVEERIFDRFCIGHTEPFYQL